MLFYANPTFQSFQESSCFKSLCTSTIKQLYSAYKKTIQIITPGKTEYIILL